MFNSGILDVAIGLVFIFLLLSLICSAINEMIEVFLKRRAANLEEGIRELLQDPEGTGLAKSIYEHLLVFGLFKGNYDPRKVSNLPSYIPSRNFALALMDILLHADKNTDSGAAEAVAPSSAGSPAPLGGGMPTSPLQPLRDAISSIQNPKVRQALITLVDAAGDDVSKARENIELWYDSAMERISGWYKRRSQKIILALGLVVAIAVNADTITIARSLSYDMSMRNSLVAASQEYAKTPQTVGSLAMTPEARVNKNLEEIQKYGLPIGWRCGDERSIPKGAGWAIKILGWLLTAMAISLGAPFWFDLLNKFMSARSTLKPSSKLLK
ncbi:MAG: hypothetical protein ACLFUU_05245 [Desulfobacteraceae bacterium]